MDEMTYNKATLDGAHKCIGLGVVFIGNDEQPANVGKITAVDDNSLCFFIRLNNDKSIYQIPFSLVMYHKASEFKEWILESIYDSIAAEYGLPPVGDMILADEAQRQYKQAQRERKKRMNEEKKAAKAARAAAKEQKQAEKKAAQENPYVIVLCKKNPETKKAEYTRQAVKSASVALSTAKALLGDETVTSVQILVKK